MTTKGVDYRAVNYLEEPLSVDALKQLLCSVGLTPQDALQIEGVYRQYVAGQNLRDDQLVRVMAAELGIGFESERCLLRHGVSTQRFLPGSFRPVAQKEQALARGGQPRHQHR